MYAESIKLRNYRNIENETVTFIPGVNYLFGDNAQGKTNILEALYFYARGKSFRLATDREQTAFGSKFYETELKFHDSVRTQDLTYRFDGKEKIRTRNGAPVTRTSEFIGHFRCVLFFPENLQMIKGGPEERRAFINIAISQCDRGYVAAYTRYRHILDQRNALLKNAQKTGAFDESQLYAWSDGLAAIAAEIHAIRLRYIDILSGYTAAFMEDLSSGKEKTAIAYESSVNAGEQSEMYRAYLAELTENWQREIAVGYTLFGVHRDDLSVTVCDRDAKLFASQGQQRSIVLCLKMAEGEACHHLTHEYPVYLFDDVLSELDPGRRQYVMRGMKDRQRIMTGCETMNFASEDVRFIKVTEGHYVPAYR